MPFGSYDRPGSMIVSCEMTDPSSTVPRSSRRERLIDRVDASERERSRRARNPGIEEAGEPLRLRLDSREPSRLFLRANAAKRERIDGCSGMCCCWLVPRPGKGTTLSSSSRHGSFWSNASDGVELLPRPVGFGKKAFLPARLLRSAKALPGLIGSGV